MRMLALLFVALVAFTVYRHVHHSSVPQPQSVSPADYVKAHADDAKSVVEAVKDVGRSIAALADTDASINSALAQIDIDFSTAQETFDKVHKDLSEAPDPQGAVSKYGFWMSDATDEMSKAMVSARAYNDDKKVSELADYRKHWDDGRRWWNEAATAIWKAANQAPPPTVLNLPSGPTF